MGDATIIGAQMRHVEVGRVLQLRNCEQTGKLAAIVEIIDHKRVLVDGPSSDPKLVVHRQAIRLDHALLTPIVINKLNRGSRTPTLKAAWEKADVDGQYKSGGWSKRKEQTERRKNLTDFDRFKVMRLKKQRRFEERKSLAKVRASAS